MNTSLITDLRLAKRTPAVACVSSPNHFSFLPLKVPSVRLRLLSVLMFYALETNYQLQKQYRMLFSLTRNAIQYP